MAVKNVIQLRENLQKYKARWKAYERTVTDAQKEKARLETGTATTLHKLIPDFSFDSRKVIADIDTALLACAQELRAQRELEKAKAKEAVLKAKLKAKPPLKKAKKGAAPE